MNIKQYIPLCCDIILYGREIYHLYLSVRNQVHDSLWLGLAWLDAARNGHYFIMLKLKIHKMMIKTKYTRLWSHWKSVIFPLKMASLTTRLRTKLTAAIGNGVTKTGVRPQSPLETNICNQVKWNYTKCHYVSDYLDLEIDDAITKTKCAFFFHLLWDKTIDLYHCDTISHIANRNVQYVFVYSY